MDAHEAAIRKAYQVAEDKDIAGWVQCFTAPCCDVFRLRNGKIQSFNCYASGTVMLSQLGVLPTRAGSV
jgi:hypothetical protein